MFSDHESLPGSPETPPPPAVTIKKPPASLSAKSKQGLINHLQTVDPVRLAKALTVVALDGYEFPTPLQPKVGPLQSAYKEHQHNELVRPLLEQAIESYFDQEGIKQFVELLHEPFNRNHWNSGFLMGLARPLAIALDDEPLVEAAIEEGKIHWRIVQGQEVIYDRSAAKGNPFNFKLSQTWQMDWEHFRWFKDSGKRSSTVAITQERFVAFFEEKYHYQASAVWQELKEKGILDANHKLSDGWRAIVNESIKLRSLSDPQLIIEKSEVIAGLKALRGKPVPKGVFIEQWPDGKKYRAGLLWAELKRQSILDEKNKITKLVFEIADVLASLHLGHTDVITALNHIANDKTYQETLPAIPEAAIFRPERSPKTWANTGRIQNRDPEQEKHCTKLWDVSIYDDLKCHRNTLNEQQSHQNHKLNYDHIPSADALTARAKKRKATYDRSEEEYLAELKQVSEAIEARFKELHEQETIPLTRRHVKQSKDEILQALEGQRVELEKKISELRNRQAQVALEMKGHGSYWWTIAIPEKLHKQGETFLQSSQDQQKVSDQPFLKDVSAYLEILEKRPEDFSITLNDYLKALGAFRYLYRCQVKPVIPIDNKYPIGSIPQALFRNPEDRQKIDQLFEKKMRQFLEKKEGVKPSESNENHWVPKSLKFN